MGRLTESDGSGNWELNGVAWEQLRAGAVLDKKTAEILYGALYKLKDYEETGLTPEKIREMDKLYWEKCQEVKELRERERWIPVEERLPENSKYILLSFDNATNTLIGRYESNSNGGVFYLGDCDDQDDCLSNDLHVNAWMPLPEPYRADGNG